ncbi:FUSC family protein [Mucilaginibacter sp. SMC90]|uniref:FUSC family protein n=1 Tax=Mucilaginibacter sp. SMC90 TaxID=2929803 RepID=UPI001FB41F04|nr:FUSC family protein [Mucilaginibacter sp. SMC90]UOE50850.1 FUSC family protein [Mucilaginibacter sp. SMC90]
MNKRILFIIYLIQCIIGVSIGFYCFQKNAEAGAWVLVSTIMVLAPDKDEAIKFAFNRIKANLIGAVVGLLLALIHPFNVFMMAFGVVLAATFCELLSIKSAIRSATVGVILISLAPVGKTFYEVAAARAIGVGLGCMIALILTVTMHALVKAIYRGSSDINGKNQEINLMEEG